MNSQPENEPQPESYSGTWSKNRRRLTIIGVIVLVLLAAAVVAVSQLKRPDDVSNPSVDFEAPVAAKPAPKKDALIDWPTFRYDRQRTGYLPVDGIRPPFRRLWKYGDQPLLEFPPTIVNGTMYFVDNDGYAHALDTDTGKSKWNRRIAKLSAATPAYSRGRLYVVNLEPGQVMSLNARNGRQIWKKTLPCRSESSPVIVGSRLYFGCESGVLYALKTQNGKSVWETSVAGAIKGAPAYDDGTLYVGDYGGAMTAVRASNGEIQWQTQALGPGLGQPGAFYSTPAVAFGRVYIGNNDSRVYSFDADTGDLAWTFSTGDWVYSGPTVAKVPGTPPTVYIGSFDGNVYALDAKSGEARWIFDMGGRVIGSLSVIGRTVYAATFDDTNTYGISAKTGKQTFSYHTGAYMPALSDGENLYLVGYSSIHALQPITRKQQLAIRNQAKARKKSRSNGARKGSNQEGSSKG
ncbi:MAG: PQQ-binding-like beta-propeller repeat protein [Solirubrobacterales bacterium]